MQPYETGLINTVTTEIIDTNANEPDDGDPIAIDNSMFMNAAAPADALWNMEDIGETIDAEAYEDPQLPDTETPDPEHSETPETETGATSSTAAPKFRIFHKSRADGDKTDAKLLKEALAKWHSRRELEKRT